MSLDIFYTKNAENRIKSIIFLIQGFSHLFERFHIKRIRVRDSFHLTNRFICKILSHTFATFLNPILGDSILHFSKLVLA